MRFGVVIPTWGDYWGNEAPVTEAIMAADRLGYHTAWFGDHIVIPEYAAHLSPPRWLDALVCAVHGAAITKSLRFATDVLVLPLRNPVELSQALATADQLSNGRLTLGVGVGYLSGEFDAVGAPAYAQRGVVTDEYLDVLRALWSADGATSFSGRWVRFQDVIPAPSPAQDPLPVLVGGNAGVAIERAVRRGDGWHPLFMAPEDYREGRQRIERRRRELGKEEPFTFSYSCSSTRVEVPGAPRVGHALHGTENVPDEYRYAPAPPTRSDGSLMFRGPADALVADFRALEEAGVEQVALRFWAGEDDLRIDDFIDQLSLFSELVASEFEDGVPAAR
jgi:probable F420-dependent oxidoreductase